MPLRPTPPPDMVFTWKIFFRYLKWRHLALTVIGLAGTIGMLEIFYNYIPFSRPSLFSLIIGTIDFVSFKLTGHFTNQSITAYIVIMILMQSGSTAALFPGRMIGKGVPAWAMKEEQAFRAGAENWSSAQKFFASLAFGLLHFNNIIYPLAACFAITLGGLYYIGIYMHMYKKTGSSQVALLESGTVHALHNLIALTVLGGWIIYSLAKLVITLIH